MTEVYTTEKSIKAQTVTKDGIIAYASARGQKGIAAFCGSYWAICLPDELLPGVLGTFGNKVRPEVKR